MICVFSPSIIGLQHLPSEYLLWLSYWTWTCLWLVKTDSVVFHLKIHTVCCTNCLPEWRMCEVCWKSQISWCIPSCLNKGWHDIQRQVKTLHCAAKNFKAPLLSALQQLKYPVLCLLYGNAWLSTVVQVCTVWNHFNLTTTSGRPEPEYTVRRVMSSEPVHDELLTKDGKQMTNN